MFVSSDFSQYACIYIIYTKLLRNISLGGSGRQVCVTNLTTPASTFVFAQNHCTGEERTIKECAGEVTEVDSCNPCQNGNGNFYGRIECLPGNIIGAYIFTNLSKNTNELTKLHCDQP